MSDHWEVVVYLDSLDKAKFLVGNLSDARQLSRRIQREGVRLTDGRGVETYWPTHQVYKVKLIPPGAVTMETILGDA